MEDPIDDFIKMLTGSVLSLIIAFLAFNALNTDIVNKDSSESKLSSFHCMFADNTKEYEISKVDLIEKINILSVAQQNDINATGNRNNFSFNMSIENRDNFIYYFDNDGKIERNKIAFNFPIYEDTNDEAYLIKKTQQKIIIVKYNNCAEVKKIGKIKSKRTITTDLVTFELHVPKGFVVEQLN